MLYNFTHQHFYQTFAGKNSYHIKIDYKKIILEYILSKE